MRWLVTGAGGQLGCDVLATVGRAAGDAVVGLSRADLDITDRASVARAFAEVRPDVVVNAAAYTAVDAAEADEDTAYAVNAQGPAFLAERCRDTGARLVHVSTDYVFDGDASVPYDVDAPTHPRSVYGRTKLAGEELIRQIDPGAYVVRTAWLYGAAGGNFVKTMIRLERAREALDVVDDQRGSPTWSADLARGIAALGVSEAPGGLYHCTNAGETTWCGLARAVFEELGADPARVRATTSVAMARSAPRPAYSVLSGSAWRAAGLPRLPPWREALARAFATTGDRLRAAE